MTIDTDPQPPELDFAALRGGISDTVFWVFFIILICDAVILRGAHVPCLTDANDATFADLLENYVFSRGANRPNFRVLGPLMVAAIEAIIHAINSLAFIDSTNSALYRGTPWPISDWVDQRAGGCGSRLLAQFVYVGLATLPVAIAVRLWVRAWWRRLLLLGLIVWPIIGWHPVIVNLLFLAGDLVADWPKSYYLFNQWLAPTDFLVVGFIFSTLLFVTQSPEPKAWWIIAGAVIAQFIFEYLGLLFALALFTGAILSDRQTPFRHALRQFSIAIGGAVVGALVCALLFYGLGGHLRGPTDFSNGLPVSIVNNLTWARSSIAIQLTMRSSAIVGGIIAGGLSRLGRPQKIDPNSARRDFAVAATLAFGFLCVFVIGFATAAYPAEMGRQFMPFASLLVFVGFMAVRFFSASRH